ncbi:MAG: flippase activity-associated protein Agl23 [Haloferacaceae archaeon]
MSRADRHDWTALAVGVLAVVALALRLYGLGARSFHWDEARVGYWTLRYLESGAFAYRPVAGGPLLYVLDRHVFALVGATDLTARLVVALLGGALPLAALLFRDRLRDSETVALAFLLAATPLLLYYSRFLRGDVPLALFALVAVGCAVRYRDRDAPGYLYAGAAALALAVASSGFVAGYLLCWLGAGLLVFDHRRLLAAGRLRGHSTDAASADAAPAQPSTSDGATDGGVSPTPGATDRLREWAAWVDAEAGTIARAVGVFALVHLFFYAPRAGATGGPGLWRPTTWLAVVDAAFAGTVRKFLGVWVVTRGQGQAGHALLPYLAHNAEVLLLTSFPLVALGLGGFLADRYSEGPPRPLVAFFAYWAGLGLLVFPILTEGQAPWVAIHVAVALTLPAAVAGGWLLRAGRRAYRDDRAGSAVAVALLVLAVVAHSGAVAAAAYHPPDRSDRLVDFAQPASDLDPFVTDVGAAIEGNDGTDVLYYGEDLQVYGDDSTRQPPVADRWGNRLPLPWYLERLDAQTASTASLEEVGRIRPPVVIATVDHRAELGSRLGDAYAASTYHLALWDRTFVVFVR